MEDREIVELYWQRDQRAISETSAKYGPYCRSIANRVLSVPEDTEEAVNDTWMAAWRSMPPHRPSLLSTYLGKLTRRIALNRWRDQNRQKRGGGTVFLALEELEECVPSAGTVESDVEGAELARALNDFLAQLPDAERVLFVRRYWHLEPLETISRDLGFTLSKVKSSLHRTRGKLKKYLEMEEWT